MSARLTTSTLKAWPALFKLRPALLPKKASTMGPAPALSGSSSAVWGRWQHTSRYNPGFSEKFSAARKVLTQFTSQEVRRVSTQNGEMSATEEQLILSAAANDKRNWLEVRWADYLGRYPYVWLRDNCRCEACYYPSCHQRSMLMVNLDLDVKPTHVEIKDDGENVEIVWSDNHTSSFPSTWLKLHRFDKTDIDPIKKLSKISWGGKFIDRIPSYSYADVMNNNESLLEWMESLIRYGLVLIKEAPAEVGVLETFSGRVAYKRLTCYGPTFRVESLFDSSSLAYTAKELGMHVDLPFYDYRPGT